MSWELVEVIESVSGGGGKGKNTAEELAKALNSKENLIIKSKYDNRTLDKRRDAWIAGAIAEGKTIECHMTVDRALRQYKTALKLQEKHGQCMDLAVKKLGDINVYNPDTGKNHLLKNHEKYVEKQGSKGNTESKTGLHEEYKGEEAKIDKTSQKGSSKNELNNASQHLRRDGKLDMRYKMNKVNEASTAASFSSKNQMNPFSFVEDFESGFGPSKNGNDFGGIFSGNTGYTGKVTASGKPDMRTTVAKAYAGGDFGGISSESSGVSNNFGGGNSGSMGGS